MSLRRFIGFAASLSLLSAPCIAQPAAQVGNTLTRAEYEAGGVPLFDGRSIEGVWDAPGRNWTVQDGSIVRTARGGDAWHHRHMIPGDFDLRFEYRGDNGATGGLSYLTNATAFAIGRTLDGLPAGCAIAPAMAGIWHKARIRVAGGITEQWVDGKRICRAQAPVPKGGDDGLFFPRLLDGKGNIGFRAMIVMPVRRVQDFQISPLAGLPQKIAIAQGLASYAETLAGMATKGPIKGLGYPAPGRLAPAGLTLSKLGEDSTAIFYRYSTPALPGLPATGMIAVPKGVKGPYRVIFSIHGTAGSPDMAMQPTSVYHDMIRGPARDGWLVIAPQMVTFNRREAPFGNTIKAADIDALERRVESYGTPVYAIEAARMVATLDAVEKQWPVNPAIVAATGLSYGGYMTGYLTAVEPRIKAGAGFAGFNPFVQPEVQPTPMDTLRAIAPKPFMLVAGDFDQFHDFGSGWAQDHLDYVKEAYGKDGRFAFVPTPAGHEYLWSVTAKFLAEALPAK